MNKKKLFLPIMITYFFSCPLLHSWWWVSRNEEPVKNYIEHVVDTLFYTHAQDFSGQQDIKELKAEAKYTILRMVDIDKSGSFNDGIVRESIYSEALTFIKNKSYAYAIEISHNFETPYLKIDKRKIAHETAEKIEQRALETLTQSPDHNGIFVVYAGEKLKNQVYQLVKQLIKKHSTNNNNPPLIYDLNEPSCNTCFEDFDTNTYKRIILACGHSLCRKCILTEYKSNDVCPICRKPTINKLKLQDQLRLP